MGIRKHFGAMVALAGMGAVWAVSGYAATADNLFDVSVTLSSQCRAKDSGTKTLNFGTYTAFQGSAQTPASAVAIEFECTRSFAPTGVSLDGNNNYGVVGGLNYQLTIGAASTTGGNAATAAAAGIGTPDLVSYSINGSMPASQAGDSTAATTATRTLTITF